MMFDAGLDEFGRLGRDGDPTKPLPVDLPFPVGEIVSIGCGLYHTVVILRDGTAWGWGQDTQFAIGTSERKNHNKPVPVTVFGDTKLKWCDCSSFCTTYLTEEGKVFICCERSMETGSPVEMIIPNPALFVAMGENGLSYAVDTDGAIYRCGDCMPPITDPPQPIMFTIPHDSPDFYTLSAPVCDFAGGVNFMIALTQDGVVWGNGKYNDGSDEFVPIASLDGIRVRRVHSYLTHIVVLTEDWIPLSCGYNGFGQLGNGIKKNTNEFASVAGLDGLKIVSIDVGKFSTTFLTDDGKVYSCGFNKYGQLLLSHTNHNVWIPELAPDIPLKATSVRAGNFHTLVLVNTQPIEHPLQKVYPLDF